MRIAYFDCFSGASGDMILAACIDAGLQIEPLRQQLAALGLEGYRIEALDVIHEMAMMTYDSAAMAEVKLKAAIALRGAPEAKVGTQDNGAVLAELNAIYQEAAPRIRTVRAVQIEYDA